MLETTSNIYNEKKDEQKIAMKIIRAMLKEIERIPQ